MSTFDTHWREHENRHGPQPPGAKEDALFWYNKGKNADAPAAPQRGEDLFKLPETPR